jgi:hypothetical protein
VLIIPEKLSSERLFIEISRTFRTYNKMYIFWKKEQYQLRIKSQIDEILNEFAPSQKETIFVFCDDFSYSGLQIVDFIQSIGWIFKTIRCNFGF